jgi:hypothetical protein
VAAIMNAQSFTSMQELHARQADGIEVRLLWSEDDGRVAVAVADAKTGDAFVIDVRDTDKPLDVFHHPFAYAAPRGVDTRACAGVAEPAGLLAA